MLNRCLFFVFLTFSALNAYSQGLVGEIGYNESYSITSEGVVANQKGSFFVRRVYQENSYFTSVLVSYMDSMNNVEWQLPVGSGELNYVTGVCRTGDGGIYVSAVSAETCDVLEDVKCQIWKINDLGSITLFKEYSTNDYHFFEGLTLLHNNHLKGLYTVPGQQAIVEYDESGVLVDSLIVSENNGNKQFLNATGYSAIGIRHSTVLTGYDALGNSTPVRTYTSQTGRMLGNGNHIYLATSDSIFKYDLSLNLVNSEALTNAGEIVQLRFLNDSTIGYLQHVGNSVSWGTLNTSLQNQQSDFYGTNLEGDLSGDFYQNRVSVGVTYELALYYGARSALYRKNSPVFTVIPQTDVALTAFEVVNQSAVLVAAPNVYQVDVDVKVTIKNLGTFPVHSIRINRDLGPGICNETMRRWYFTGLNLLPGDTMQLELGSAGSYINVFSVPEIQSQVCIYSSFVNELADLNVANDQHCENVVYGYAGINELETDNFVLFPNPSSGDFSITRSGNENVQITVYSVSGALIQTPVETTETVINLHLNPGIYLVQLVGEAGNKVVKRVVIN